MAKTVLTGIILNCDFKTVIDHRMSKAMQSDKVAKIATAFFSAAENVVIAETKVDTNYIASEDGTKSIPYGLLIYFWGEDKSCLGHMIATNED